MPGQAAVPAEHRGVQKCPKEVARYTTVASHDHWICRIKVPGTNSLPGIQCTVKVPAILQQRAAGRLKGSRVY
jgi:hypothetical protein